MSSACWQHFRPTTRTVAAVSLRQRSTIETQTFLAHFQRYVKYRQLTDQDITAIFPLFIRRLIGWYDALSVQLKNDVTRFGDIAYGSQQYLAKQPKMRNMAICYVESTALRCKETPKAGDALASIANAYMFLAIIFIYSVPLV